MIAGKTHRGRSPTEERNWAESQLPPREDARMGAARELQLNESRSFAMGQSPVSDPHPARMPQLVIAATAVHRFLIRVWAWMVEERFGSAAPGRALQAIVLAVLVCFPVAAVEPYKPVLGDAMLEPWRWRSFAELSGLGLQAMIEASDGVLWFGMSDGVWSFDGVEWKHIPSSKLGGGVVGFAKSPDGRLHLMRRTAIVHRVGEHWHTIFPEYGQFFGNLRKIHFTRDGSIWAVTEWGLVQGNNGRWTLHTGPEIISQLRSNRSNPNVELRAFPETILSKPRAANLSKRRFDLSAIAEDQQGRLWLGTETGEILSYDPAADRGATNSAAWAIYNETDGMVCGRGPSLLAAQDGTIWVAYGLGSGHVNILNNGRWKIIRLADVGVPDDIGEIMQTRDGVIWFSARYVISAYRHGQWRSYQPPEVSIPSARNFMMQTRDGAFWLAGPATEIVRIDYETRGRYTLNDLNFQVETADGTQWFLHRFGRIVVHRGTNWFSYGVEDGVIDTPVGMIATAKGVVWVAGSHGRTAATARFENGQWTRFIHEEFAWGVDWRGLYAATDGSVWFTAAVDSSGPPQHRDGLLQFRDGKWIHHHQPGRAPTGRDDTDPETLLPATQRPEPIGKFLSVAESRDGRMWTGRNILAYRQDGQWTLLVPETNRQWGVIETMFTSSKGELWVGTRQFGALRYDGRRWDHFQGKGSLVANTVRSITETDDGSLWIATDRDVNHFDGATWTPGVLPPQLSIPHEGGTLKASPSTIWINHFTPDWTRRAWRKAARINITNCVFWTVSHMFKGIPPETTIKSAPKSVSHPGNISIFWSAVDPWRSPQGSRLQFSFRLNDSSWSPFTFDLGHSFFTLPPGPHRFEVRARDQNFNIDPTPAVLEFVVLPPVWQQGWFIALMVLLGGLVLTQSFRVFLERAQLRVSNRALEAEVKERERAEQELKQLNLELDQRVKARTKELEVANKELEAFSYSVSHDLRAPLRSIDGFSRALLEDYSDKLDSEGKEDLMAVRAASQRMGQLIDDMLLLAKVTRSELHPMNTDLSEIAVEVVNQLRRADPKRKVDVRIAPGMTAEADPRFMRIVFENLFGNAWKFTGKTEDARIEFGRSDDNGTATFFIRDNGVGFDMAYAHKLFGAFQRLHAVTDFPGTGIGLATVQRIIHRQGGRVWAESALNQGATFYFTLPHQLPAKPSESV